MSDPKDRNPAQVAQDLANGSGNNFHSKVIKFFRDNDWAVLISPYYVDPSTDKAREIDLIAEKLFETVNIWRHPNGVVRVRLHIECKYINQATVFWLDEMDRSKALSRASNYVLRENNSYIKEHHYLKDTKYVAKLFATEKAKDTENEPMFKAVNQTLNALVSNAHSSLLDSRLPVHVTVDYPVIVCSTFSSFFSRHMNGDEAVSQVDQNFLMEVNYAYSRGGRPISEYFLIDVVEFEQLGALLAVLQHEVEAMRELLYEA